MQMYEARLAAISAAANLNIEGTPVSKRATHFAIRFLIGEITREEFFAKCATEVTYARLVSCSSAIKPEDFTLEKLCSMHEYIYSPKEGCGTIRTTELNLTGGSCTAPGLLRGSLKNVLSRLCQTKGSPSLSKADFAAELCCYVRELIILSPFAYGNGVVRRAFIQNFCRSRGFTLTYASASARELTDAATAAFAGDDPQPLFTVLIKCLNYFTEPSASTRRARSAELEPVQNRKPAVAEPDTEKILKELYGVQKALGDMTAHIEALIESLKK